jgi:hypothetical protein
MAINGTTILAQADDVGLTVQCRCLWLRGPVWVSISDIGNSFDDLVGELLELRWHIET